MIKTLKVMTILAMGMQLVSCSLTIVTRESPNQNSGLAEITFGDLGEKVKAYGDKGALVTGYALTVKGNASQNPSNNFQSCSEIFKSGPIENSKSIDASLARGCDYFLILELGIFNASSVTLSKVYLSSKKGSATSGLKISAKDLETERLKVDVPLFLTDAGTQDGFKQSNSGSSEISVGKELELANGIDLLGEKNASGIRGNVSYPGVKQGSSATSDACLILTVAPNQNQEALEKIAANVRGVEIFGRWPDSLENETDLQMRIKDGRLVYFLKTILSNYSGVVGISTKDSRPFSDVMAPFQLQQAVIKYERNCTYNQ